MPTFYWTKFKKREKKIFVCFWFGNQLERNFEQYTSSASCSCITFLLHGSHQFVWFSQWVFYVLWFFVWSGQTILAVDEPKHTFEHWPWSLCTSEKEMENEWNSEWAQTNKQILIFYMVTCWLFTNLFIFILAWNSMRISRAHAE